MNTQSAPHTPMLVAEDLLLLLTDDVTGSTAASTHLSLLLGGALLSELALDGTAVLDPKAGRGLFASDRIMAVAPPAGPADRQTQAGQTQARQKQARPIHCSPGRGASSRRSHAALPTS